MRYTSKNPHPRVRPTLFETDTVGTLSVHVRVGTLEVLGIELNGDPMTDAFIAKLQGESIGEAVRITMETLGVKRSTAEVAPSSIDHEAGIATLRKAVAIPLAEPRAIAWEVAR